MTASTRGGARKGAGRHKIDPRLKKVPVGYKLPRWLVDWMRAQSDWSSAAALIETAMRARYGLTPPGGADDS